MRKKYYIILISLILFLVPFFFQSKSDEALLSHAEYSLKRMTNSYKPSTLEIARDFFRSAGQDWGSDYDNSIKELINRSYFIESIILLPKNINSKQVFNEFEEGQLSHSFIQNQELHLIGRKENVDSARIKIHMLIQH